MATNYGKTERFIFDNGTFFSAKTSAGNVRIGMNGLRSFDVPPTHALYNLALVADSETDVEDLFDRLMSVIDYKI